MSQTVDLEVFYPYPPERVWQVLTDRRALAAWMMENDFEPKVGHRFQFHSQPLPGLQSTIQCEVVELEEPSRLVYTWQESPTAERSLVIWTLTTVANGTRLRLKHHQHSYAARAMRSSLGSLSTKRSFDGTTGFYGSGQPYEELPGSLALDCLLDHPTVHRTLLRKTRSIASDFSAVPIPPQQAFTWNYVLNQMLPQVLLQFDSFENSFSLSH
ncbi:MAG: SRPBCC domain-containing protein [Synechococcales cyanobacterium M58_A2018_015]|nr:SRPBCC domain-containing protein [Synechococcales cyanobacterium M58_A2018_015]